MQNPFVMTSFTRTPTMMADCIKHALKQRCQTGSLLCLVLCLH